MHTTLLSCVLCLTLINLMVDGSRTPKQGHIMLSGISLEPSEFEKHVSQMANRIEQLQTADDGPASQLVQRYILPVFLYVHEATRISQSPVYLALNVQPSGPDAKQFLNYLQIVEIYDERYYQPIMQTSSLTPFTYPNKIQPFNPTNELDRHYVIAGLRDPKIRQEVITRLSLVFVESIRFYSVRRAVQQALNMKGAVDFAPHMPLIRQWEAMTNDLVHLLTMNRNGIEVDQKLPVTSSNQNVYSVSVFHLNAAAQVNMWFLYQFIRCNNQYHQQTQDGDGSCDVDTWSQTKWKVGCKNANGRDVPTGNLNLESCAQMCQRTPTCSHFSWKKNNCYLKSGPVVATEEKQTYDLHDTCGFKTPRKNFVVANKYGGRQSVSSTPGYSGGNQYGSGRMPSAVCSNIRRGPYNTLVLTDTQGQQRQVSNRYGWSQHNYPCRGIKTGLVLYPTDVMYKNTVLLLCDGDFYYHPKARGNRHEQLMRWYYNIYRSSKQFSLVSGFTVQPDGTFEFNTWQQQLPGLYTDSVNNMDGCEQDVIRHVVNGRIDSHAV